MPRSRHEDAAFKYRHFDQDIIVLCVRWYVTYRLSYRDLVEMMAERDTSVSPSTIYRWVQRFVPEFEERWDQRRKRVGKSWRVDETYVMVNQRWHYLYRADDKQGRTVDLVLRKDRGTEAAKAFFRKALESNGGRPPRKVTLDGHVPSHRVLRLLRREDKRWSQVFVRSCKYLNNIVEQDHRAIKRRIVGMMEFKIFDSAAVTLAGIELAHRIRKGAVCTRTRTKRKAIQYAHCVESRIIRGRVKEQGQFESFDAQ